jgi:hypothetical protein
VRYSAHVFTLLCHFGCVAGKDCRRTGVVEKKKTELLST